MTSKRSLENRLDELDNGGDYPDLSLAVLLSSDEIEGVGGEPGLVRIDGQIYEGAGLADALMDRFEEVSQ